MDKLLLAIAGLLSFFIIAHAISFISNWRKKNFNKAVKEIGLANIVNVANLLVAVLALVMAYFANKDGARLLDANIEFLKTAGKINDTAKNINQQSVTFLDLSIRTLDGFNKQSKMILDGAGQMNERSRAFLEASQGSLETFRNTANELQKVMQSNIDLSNKQIEILTATLKREEELLNRTAIITFSFENIDLIHRNNTEPVPIDIDPSMEWKKLNFIIGNTGLVPLKKPIVVFTAVPPSVCIKDSNGDGECNYYQFSGMNVIDALNPGTLNRFPIQVKLPNDLQSFEISMTVSGEGLQNQVGAMILFKINRLKPSQTPVKN